MTVHIDTRDLAGIPVASRTSGMLAAVACLIVTGLRFVADGTRAGWRRFFNGLHESRRKQAAIELAKHRYLIYDPTTGVSFGFDATARHSAPPE